MRDHSKTVDEARTFARLHVKECCEEILEWRKKALLRDGRLRELGKICARLDTLHDLRIAEDFVVQVALEVIASKE
jgi:hypothetical protein